MTFSLYVDWLSAWRWFSVQAMTLAGAIVVAYGALPPDWRAAIPHWAFTLLVLLVLVSGIVGRVVKQEPAAKP